jgi:serine/threonine protein kinase
MKKDDEAALRIEIDILGSLNHQNIVRQYEYFEEKDKFYVVLELLEGGELFDRIVKKTSYNEEEARQLVVILFNAIKYCHNNSIAHRDLKPENLLLASLDNDSDVKLADFGFAKRATGFSLSTQCGSPGYVAPEILNGVKYGKCGAELSQLILFCFILFYVPS